MSRSSPREAAAWRCMSRSPVLRPSVYCLVDLWEEGGDGFGDKVLEVECRFLVAEVEPELLRHLKHSGAEVDFFFNRVWEREHTRVWVEQEGWGSKPGAARAHLEHVLLALEVGHASVDHQQQEVQDQVGRRTQDVEGLTTQDTEPLVPAGERGWGGQGCASSGMGPGLPQMRNRQATATRTDRTARRRSRGNTKVAET